MKPETTVARVAETILLIEDEDAVRDVLRQTLEREGYVVVAAADGEDALSAASAHTGPLHAVVTDVAMPRMGGPETVERLHSPRPGLPVIFISGDVQDPTALVRGGASFLQKPFAPQALAQLLRERLDLPSMPPMQ
jgi:CheY-like chemotaxis protein